MITDTVLARLSQIQSRLVANLSHSIRPFIDDLEISDRGALIVGPRGVGKTYFLLRNLENRHGLYISLDNPMARGATLYDLIEAAVMRGYEYVFLDEVHYSDEWAIQLKGAYDAFPNVVIWASDSSTVVLRGGVADLSRRFPIKTIPLMSLREFIALRADVMLPAFDPFSGDRLSGARAIKQINVLKLFSEYLHFGFRPIFLENVSSYPDKIMNTIFKSIEADVPYFLPQLSENHIRLMQAVIGHLGTSTIPRVSVNALCKKWRIGKDKLYQLLSVLERAHVLRMIRKKHDPSSSSIGAKIFLFEPAAYFYFTDHPGTRREAYVAAATMEAGNSVWATKDERAGDFIINDKTVEVGGPSKKSKGADFVIRDDTDVPYDNVIPMWSLGMMY